MTGTRLKTSHPDPQHPQVLDLGIVNQTANANVDFILDDLGPETGWEVINGELHGTSAGAGRMDFDIPNRLPGVKVKIAPDKSLITPANPVQVGIGIAVRIPGDPNDTYGRYRGLLKYEDTGLPDDQLVRTLQLYFVPVDSTPVLIAESLGTTVDPTEVPPVLYLSCSGSVVTLNISNDPDADSIQVAVDSHVREDIVALEIIATTTGTARFDDLTWSVHSTNFTTTTYAYDVMNRLVSIDNDDTKVEYNDHDEMVEKIQDGFRYEYSYDLLGRMTKLVKTDLQTLNSDTHTYTYYGSSWMRATAREGSGAITTYTYDGFNCVRQSTGGLDTDYFFLGTKPLWEKTEGSSAKTFLTDGRNNVTGKFDGALTSAEQNFDAYGVNTRQFESSPHYSVLGFDGQLHDTATGLNYHRHRFYDVKLGRFTREDPIRDGMNWHIYAGGSPTKFRDPTGLAGIMQKDRSGKLTWTWIDVRDKGGKLVRTELDALNTMFEMDKPNKDGELPIPITENNKAEYINKMLKAYSDLLEAGGEGIWVRNAAERTIMKKREKDAAWQAYLAKLLKIQPKSDELLALEKQGVTVGYLPQGSWAPMWKGSEAKVLAKLAPKVTVYRVDHIPPIDLGLGDAGNTTHTVGTVAPTGVGRNRGKYQTPKDDWVFVVLSMGDFSKMGLGLQPGEDVWVTVNDNTGLVLGKEPVARNRNPLIVSSGNKAYPCQPRAANIEGQNRYSMTTRGFKGPALATSNQVAVMIPKSHFKHLRAGYAITFHIHMNVYDPKAKRLPPGEAKQAILDWKLGLSNKGNRVAPRPFEPPVSVKAYSKTITFY